MFTGNQTTAAGPRATTRHLSAVGRGLPRPKVCRGTRKSNARGGPSRSRLTSIVSTVCRPGSTRRLPDSATGYSTSLPRPKSDRGRPRRKTKVGATRGRHRALGGGKRGQAHILTIRSRACGSQEWTDRIAQKLGLESTLRPRGRPRLQQSADKR
jgi:hypothetical protein